MGVIPIPLLLFLGLLLPVSHSVSHTVEPIDSDHSVLTSAPQSATHVPDSTPVVVYSATNLVVIESNQRQKISYRQCSPAAGVSRNHLQKRQISLSAGGPAWLTEASTPEERSEAAAGGATLKQMGGLEYWTFFAALIRLQFQNGFGDFSFVSNLDPVKFGTGQGLPLIIFLVVVFLIMIVTSLAAPFACCCFFGGCCLRGKVAYKPWKRISTAVCIVIFSILLIIGAITNISGSAQLSLGIRTTWGSFNGLIEDVHHLADRLDPTVKDVLKLAETTVNGSIDNFASIDVPLLRSMVGGQVLQMAGNLKAIKSNLGYVKQNGTTLQSTIDDLKDQIAKLESDLNIALSSAQGLNAHITLNGKGYELIQDITGIPSGETIDVSGLPNITQLIEPIDSVPDLDEEATKLTSQFDDIEGLISEFLVEKTTTIKDQIKEQIDTAGLTASEMLTVQVSSLSSQIDGIKQQAGTYVGYVGTYDIHRHLAMIGVSGVVFAGILAVGGGIITKSKRIVCCCGVALVPLVSFAALWGLVFFVGDLAVGTLCTQYDNSFANIAIPGMPPEMMAMIQKIPGIINDCYGGDVTMVDIAKEFGMDLDVVALILGQLTSSFNITSIASQIDLSTAVQLDNYDVGALTSSYLDFSVNLTAFDEVSTGDLRDGMGQLSTALQDLHRDLTTAMFQYDSFPSTTQGEMDAVLIDFRSRINDTLTAIGVVNATEATVSATIEKIKLDAAEMVEYIDAAKSEGSKASAAFAEFSAGVDTFLAETKTDFTTSKSDQVLEDIHGLVVKVNETVTELAQCKLLSSDVKATLNSLCISTLGGFDALWFSLVFMSVFLICMAITSCCAACRLADPDAYEGDGMDDYGDKSKQRYKPTKPTIAKTFSLDEIKKSSQMAPNEGINTSREEIDRMMRKQDEETAERKKKLEEENAAKDEKVTLRRDGSKASTVRREPSLDETPPAAPFRNSMSARRRTSQTSVLNRPPSLIQTPQAASPSSSKIGRSDYLALPTGPQLVTQAPPVYSPGGTLRNEKVQNPRVLSFVAAPSSSKQATATLDDLEAEMARLAQDTGTDADNSNKSASNTLQPEPGRTRTSTFGDRSAECVPTTIFEANSVPILSVNDPAQLDQINAQLEGRQYESTTRNQKMYSGAPFEGTNNSTLSIAVPPYSPSEMSPLSASEHAESPLLSQPPLPSFPPPAAPDKSHYGQ